MARKSFVLFLFLSIFFTWTFSASVPDFTLNGLDGQSFKMADFIGKKIIVIDFWATWCVPCKRLLKQLHKIRKDFPQVEFLAISVDDSTSRANVRQYINSKGYEFTVLLDPDSYVSKMFNPEKKIPFSLIIDTRGEIVHSQVGYNPGDEQKIKKVLQELTQ